MVTNMTVNAGLSAGSYSIAYDDSANTVTVYDSEGNEIDSGDTSTIGSGDVTTTNGYFTIASGTYTAGSADFDVEIEADVTITDSAGTTISSDSGLSTDADSVITTTGGIAITVDSSLTDATDNITLFDSDIITINNNSISFQIGANEGQTTEMAINDMSTSALGVDEIDVTTADNAEAAVDVIDDAVKSVSSERAQLGAYQNRLQHTINNLETQSENLTSAQSRIRDADMAAEMTEYSQNNVLTQAATSMLAQANSQTQNVLTLLQ
ncbi:hypothetical protein GM661_12640 [Iocasia frigidifontis]|uniref:Flagellin C-terminal domain-containing protein n=2 Tax=Iocasia fonsfrigidae TaxID=2682810 RepID=A0A8A7KPQ5_9FIRM|nr:hypothetical protein GM661_12640 [Iocasia fonsfrigidae]